MNDHTATPPACDQCGTAHGYIDHDCPAARSGRNYAELEAENEALRAELRVLTSQLTAARGALTKAVADIPRIGLARVQRPLCTACRRAA